MFALTLFSRRLSVTFWGKLLMVLLCLFLLNPQGISSSTAAVIMAPLTAPTDFQLVETFDTLALGGLHGQNGWVASSAITVVADPENGANRVMWVDRASVEGYKAFPNPLANPSTGTLHFRLRRDGYIDGYAGASAQSAPTDFFSFETQLGGTRDLAENEFTVRRSASEYKSLGSGFADLTWYCVWLVANNPADTFEVYVKGGIYPTITQLNAAGQTAFGFRNGGNSSLLTFFTRSGERTLGDYYIDDIYVDPTSANLNIPSANCGGVPPDTTPPTVTWTTPIGNGQTYQVACGSPVTLAVTATDAGGVNRVEFSRLTNSGHVPIANDSSTPYETTINVCDLQLGLNEITATAVDNANNRAESKIWLNRNAPPAVNAGTDQPITLPAEITLNGTVTDDGLPSPPGVVTVAWSRQSGPGVVTFANPTAVATTATFSVPGLYTLRLTANDSQFVTSDEMVVTVNSGATPPTPQFTADKTTGIKPLQVNFIDQSIGVITNWVWNFGDGGMSVAQNPSYTYTTAGDYTVSLAVTGPGGTNSKIVSAYIRVLNPPAPDVPTLQTIENSEQDGAYTVSWNAVTNATLYELQEQVNGGDWRLIYSGGGTSHPLVDKTNGVWCYQARALNATTSSLWSGAQCTMVNATPPPTPTFTSTPTPLPTEVVGTAGAKIFLPAINRQVPPTPTPTVTPLPGWQLLGQNTLSAALLVRQGDKLFVGERKNQSPRHGIYQRPLNNCLATPDFVPGAAIDSSVLGLAFADHQGIAAAYDRGIFYSNDGGNTWLRSKTEVKNPNAVTISSGSAVAGTEADGLYISSDGGQTWTNRASDPKNINTLHIQGTTLWIGTAKTGVWKLVAAGAAPVAQNDGLTDGASLDIWDFAFDQSNNIYMATSNGVYRSNVNTIFWQPFGLQNSQLLSLEITNDMLYVGLVNQGVWQRSLSGDNWQQVTTVGWNPIPTFIRDLYYEPTCQGLLAATSSGVWFYR